MLSPTVAGADSSTARVRGCAGKTTGSSSRERPSTIARQPLGLHVRLAVDRRDDVAARLEPEALERARAPARDRGEPLGGVVHDVAHDLRAAPDLLAGQDVARALVRAQQQRRDPVGLDAVVLLRHRPVAAAQPGLDVRDRHPLGDGRSRSGERRVRVPVDEHPVGPLVGDDRLERRLQRRQHLLARQCADAEAVRRLGQPELLEEDVRQLAVVVLAGVHHDLFVTGLTQCFRQRRRLDELRPVADDGQDAHGGSVRTRSP